MKNNNNLNNDSCDYINLKTLLVERAIICPMCGAELFNGDIIYRDEDRDETLCGYCKEDYEHTIIQEEGEYGQLLK